MNASVMAVFILASLPRMKLQMSIKMTNSVNRKTAQGALVLCSLITMTGAVLLEFPFKPSLVWALIAAKLELILFRGWSFKGHGMLLFDVLVQG